jgi:hypothetical protein
MGQVEVMEGNGREKRSMATPIPLQLIAALMKPAPSLQAISGISSVNQVLGAQTERWDWLSYW